MAMRYLRDSQMIADRESSPLRPFLFMMDGVEHDVNHEATIGIEGDNWNGFAFTMWRINDGIKISIEKCLDKP